MNDEERAGASKIGELKWEREGRSTRRTLLLVGSGIGSKNAISCLHCEH